MRKGFRILMAMVVFLSLFGIIAFFVLLDPVDYIPYFKTGYYERTMERLETDKEKMSSATGALYIGMSRVNITPAENSGLALKEIPLAGYGNREGLPARGVHDSLYIKALAFKVGGAMMVWVGVDLLIVPPAVVDLVHEDLEAVSRSEVYYSATHTHSSLGGWASNRVGEIFAGSLRPEIINWLAQKFTLAIRSAIADLQPGGFAHGQFEAPDLVKNRLVGEMGQEHATCSYMLAEQWQGKKAVVAIFDAHATTLSDDNWAFSADYPAYWYQKLEAAGIDLAMFCAGSVGSHGPESGLADFAEAEYIGTQLADRVLAHSDWNSLRDTVSLYSLNLSLDLPEVHIRVSDGWRLAPFISRKLFPPFGKVYLQSVRINDLILTSTPADYSGESALVHQDRLYKKGFDAGFTSFNGAYIGYILPAKYYHFDEYESRLMSWFGPNMGPYLEEVIYRMTEHLAEAD